MSILERFKPEFWKFQDSLNRGSEAKSLFNFQRLWKSSVLLISAVSLVPLICITVLDYKATQHSIEAEFFLRSAIIVSNTCRSISFFFTERRSSLDFIVYDNEFEALNEKLRLIKILENLRKGFGKFTDIGVIDSSGKQRNYIGPYNLKDKDYSDQEWFKHVMNQGIYISEVYLGYRKVPHLVIAVKRDLENEDFFILRATLDIEPFESLLTNLKVDAGEALIINHEGVLQTSSRNYGKVFEKINLNVPKYFSKAEVYEVKKSNGESLIVGYRYIEQTPFILMIIKKKRDIMETWQDTRVKLVIFLFVSIFLILVVIIRTTTYMVNKIYLADKKRIMIFHQAEYANKMASVGRLAAGVAHEINNPLAIINEKVGLIKDLFTYQGSKVDNQKLINLIDSALSSVKRCGRITKRLLKFARHMDVSIEIIDLDELIHEVLSFLEKEAEYRSIVVSVNVHDVPSIKSDRGKLQQIFLNIINNAFAAMGDGGNLDVTAKYGRKNIVIITIADDGYGISEEEIGHVFEPFFSTKTGQGGTGLGLSITYSLVKELGGDISVQSEVGHGTSFTIMLPLKQEI